MERKQLKSVTSKTEAKLQSSSRPQFLGPDADSGIEDEDPNSPSATPSSATPSKPPSTLVGEHKLLSPLTSCNGFLDTIRAPTSAESYSMEGVVQHNLLRRIHDTPPLRHSLELQKMAQSYADYLAEARMGEESQKSSNFEVYGENILYVPYVCFMSAKQAVQLWYRQLRSMDIAEVSEERFHSISSFCQVVWEGSESVGIGVSFGRRGGCYIVANYYPKMHLNSLPRFLRNVHPPLTPSSVPREEQYELWCSLRNTHLQHEDGDDSNQQFDKLLAGELSGGSARFQRTWEMAVVVENFKRRIVSGPESAGKTNQAQK
ncbi:uncharacterized protein LOC134839403 isoform X2 [Symsagittifera roscoffensis]|uniref:uncharacterized protein LOC134839403 isoform X2 n=1 Tax=Symsagittifera roscoffensis TaxID=84072 RepID=UPI00307BADF0